MHSKGKVLYIGGFQLPDRNAAAQRVVGIAKGLRDLSYDVSFLNSVKDTDETDITEKEYFGFHCFEYARESDKDYLLSAKTTLSMIDRTQPDIVIAYNYPAIALNRIRKYCQKKNIKIIGDVTEWYEAYGGNIVYRLIKNLDSSYRMKRVHKKLNGVITISRYLYDYYKDSVQTVMIPPTVDISDEKWKLDEPKEPGLFVYAGSPSAQKEKLDVVVRAIEECAKKMLVRLYVVGITEDEFRKMYSWNESVSEAVSFFGRVSHTETLRIVKKVSWSIILRDNNRVVQAGFPTKFVESISCGTPVIANRFSNIEDYIDENNGILVSINSLLTTIEYACNALTNSSKDIFDYHRYVVNLGNFMESPIFSQFERPRER